MAAVVERAARRGAAGRELGAHVGRAASWSGDVHQRARRDPAVVARAGLALQRAARLAQLDHGHAVRIDLLDHFFLRAVWRRGAEVGAAGGVQEHRRAGDVLVVHAQQPAVAGAVVAHIDAGAQAEPVHAVVVVAGPPVVARLAAVAHVLGGDGGVERVAGGEDDGGRVAVGDVNVVVGEAAEGVEIELLGRDVAGRHRPDRCLGIASGHQAGATEAGGGHRRQAAQQHVAPLHAALDEVSQVERIAGILVDVVRLDGHRQRRIGEVHGVSWQGGFWMERDFRRRGGAPACRCPQGRRASAHRYRARARRSRCRRPRCCRGTRRSLRCCCW